MDKMRVISITDTLLEDNKIDDLCQRHHKLQKSRRTQPLYMYEVILDLRLLRMLASCSRGGVFKFPACASSIDDGVQSSHCGVVEKILLAL